jgi:hypothetical protein
MKKTNQNANLVQRVSREMMDRIATGMQDVEKSVKAADELA